MSEDAGDLALLMLLTMLALGGGVVVASAVIRLGQAIDRNRRSRSR